MALDYWEKDILDRKCKSIMEEVGIGAISKQVFLCDKLENNYSITSVIASLKRIIGEDAWGAQVIYDTDNKLFIFREPRKRLDFWNYDVSKNKNILSFECYKGLEWDFVTKTFNMKEDEFDHFDRYFTNQIKDLLENYEWIFNYCVDLREVLAIVQNLDDEYTKKMPSGLYDFMNSVNIQELTVEIFSHFIFMKEFGKYASFAEKICSGSCINSPMGSSLKTFLEDYSFDAIFKITKNTLINGIFIDVHSVRYLLSLYSEVKRLELNPYIDTNRDFRHNITTLENLRDYEKNLKLAEKMQQLNFINGMTLANGEFTVVVPQSQEEKQDEGRQQNNCVGSYYDDSILRGDNLIYFIRSSHNVKHSYITCRYNVKAKKTVEARLVNNYEIEKNLWELIGSLDEIIRKNLK